MAPGTNTLVSLNTSLPEILLRTMAVCGRLQTPQGNGRTSVTRLFAQTWVQAKALLWWGRYHHLLLCALLFLHMKVKVFYCAPILSVGPQCLTVPLVAENLFQGEAQLRMMVVIYACRQVNLSTTGNAYQKTPEKFARRSSAFMMVLRWMA